MQKWLGKKPSEKGYENSKDGILTFKVPFFSRPFAADRHEYTISLNQEFKFQLG